MEKSVSIILINYNGWMDTVECINSIFLSEYKNIKIIVVDNDSKNDSVEMISKYLYGNEIKLEDITYLNVQPFCEFEYVDSESLDEYKVENNNKIYFIKSKTNLGFSKANNLGMKFDEKYLKSDYIWILNNDVIVEKNTINILVDSDKRENKNEMLGCTILEYYDRSKIQCTMGGKYNKFLTLSQNENKGRNVTEISDLKENCDYISGCSIFGKRILFKKVNYFSEDYFLYFEELDFMEKLKKEKIQIRWEKKACIYHKEGNSIGSKNIKHKKSKLSEYYSNYSCLVYSQKYYKLWIIMAFIRYILKITKFIIKREFYLMKSLNNAYSDFFKRGKKE